MTIRHCAFLTLEDTTGWSIDADLAIAPLHARGWVVETVPWRRATDWRRFAAVYIGTPWDYPDDPQRFLQVLQNIERAGVVLANRLGLVRWNLSKTYLRELESTGVAIVPSDWYDTLTAETLRSVLENRAGEQVVVKPVISTNARDTFLLSPDIDTATRDRLLATFNQRPFVVQPFIGGIRRDGEYSLFFFGRRFSHAIRKVPADGDFRVQEEHGADIEAVQPESALVDTAANVLARLRPAPLYARCDFVRDDAGHYLLMELELIEPSLYLRTNDGAAERFADAFDRYVTRAACSRRASEAASEIRR